MKTVSDLSEVHQNVENRMLYFEHGISKEKQQECEHKLRHDRFKLQRGHTAEMREEIFERHIGLRAKSMANLESVRLATHLEREGLQNALESQKHRLNAKLQELDWWKSQAAVIGQRLEEARKEKENKVSGLLNANSVREAPNGVSAAGQFDSIGWGTIEPPPFASFAPPALPESAGSSAAEFAANSSVLPHLESFPPPAAGSGVIGPSMGAVPAVGLPPAAVAGNVPQGVQPFEMPSGPGTSATLTPFAGLDCNPFTRTPMPSSTRVGHLQPPAGLLQPQIGFQQVNFGAPSWQVHRNR